MIQFFDHWCRRSAIFYSDMLDQAFTAYSFQEVMQYWIKASYSYTLWLSRQRNFVSTSLTILISFRRENWICRVFLFRVHPNDIHFEDERNCSGFHSEDESISDDRVREKDPAVNDSWRGRVEGSRLDLKNLQKKIEIFFRISCLSFFVTT